MNFEKECNAAIYVDGELEEHYCLQDLVQL
jgi:hypothetical protein